MDPFVRRFIRSSLAWFTVGMALGLYLAFAPMQAALIRPAHVHANLLGFVSMMIFGVAYHVLPRFSGVPLHDRRLPTLHLWISNVGLAALVLGWTVRALSTLAGEILVGGGAALSAAGGALFVYNLWRTLDAAGAAARGPVVPSRARRAPLPTA